MHFHLHAQFFFEFPAQTVLETLARFNLATGKFPQAAEMSVRIALGNEQLAVTKNQGGGDGDGIHWRRGEMCCVLRVASSVCANAGETYLNNTQHVPQSPHRPTLL